MDLECIMLIEETQTNKRKENCKLLHVWMLGYMYVNSSKGGWHVMCRMGDILGDEQGQTAGPWAHVPSKRI